MSKEKGTISTSMGVNTKPALKLEYKGHWVLVDPKISEYDYAQLRVSLKLGCGHCAHEDESVFFNPCISCKLFSNFKPKE